MVEMGFLKAGGLRVLLRRAVPLTWKFPEACELLGMRR